jgi:hypothetical protein
MSNRNWQADLMVTDDDAGSIHWRKSGCCDVGPVGQLCVKFFDEYDASQLYPPWNEWHAASEKKEKETNSP